MDTKMGRRGVLACMGLAGAGIVWTVTGGVPRMLGIEEADAADLGGLAAMGRLPATDRRVSDGFAAFAPRRWR